MAIQARYPKQVVVMVTPQVREYLDKEADTRGVSMAQVARELLDEALAARGSHVGEFWDQIKQKEGI